MRLTLLKPHETLMGKVSPFHFVKSTLHVQFIISSKTTHGNPILTVRDEMEALKCKNIYNPALQQVRKLNAFR